MKKMHKAAASFVLALMLVSGIALPAGAQTPTSTGAIDLSGMTNEQLLEIIQSLTAQVEALKLRIQNFVQARQEARLELRQELRQGATGEEVRILQRFLSTDPSIYPEGLVTGFFGPLTSQALSRFQAKFKLEARGLITPETLELINEILEAQGVTQTIPPGLLIAPGLQNRIKVEIITNEDGTTEFKIEVECDSSGPGNACPDDDDDEEDEDEMDDVDDDDEDEDEDTEDETEEEDEND